MTILLQVSLTKGTYVRIIRYYIEGGFLECTIIAMNLEGSSL